MVDLLPAEVRCNRRPGRQGADFAARMRADTPAMDAAVASLSSHPAAVEYLDVPALQASWRTLRDDSGRTAFHDAFAFGRALQFGLFLAGRA